MRYRISFSGNFKRRRRSNKFLMSFSMKPQGIIIIIIIIIIIVIIIIIIIIIVIIIIINKV